MLRDVIEEPHFTEEFDLLRKSYAEMDTVHAAITFALASDPRIGDTLKSFPHPTIRVLQTSPTDTLPVFLVLYRYTDKLVILLGIDRL
jgi:hypothetical protein